MRAFRIVLFLVALIPLLTGAIDLAFGLRAQQSLGAGLSPQDVLNPLLDSQFRFLSAIWIGFGVLLLVCLTDLARYATLLTGALAFVFLGGIGRVIGYFETGQPASGQGAGLVIASAAVELVGMPLLMLWHRRLATPTKPLQ